MNLFNVLSKLFIPKLFLEWGGGGGSEQKDPMANMAWIQKPAYTGQRPYTGSEVGLGSEQLKPISEQYIKQIMERSRGEGQVGFQPEWYDTRKRQGLGDLAENYANTRKRLSGQASGQGLRGGIPVSIQREAAEDYGDTTSDFLDSLTTADLEARRADINSATKQQPEAIKLGSNIQQNRAIFDLDEYGTTMPYLYEYPQEENDAEAGGDIFGGMLGSFGGGGQQGGGSDWMSLAANLLKAYQGRGLGNNIGANKSLAGGVPSGTWLTPSQLSYQNSL